MKSETYQSSETRKTYPQKRMHAFRKPVLCKGIDCEVQFHPRRKDQIFCSPACRLKYFDVARAIGLILLENYKADARLKGIADELLEILRQSVNLG